MREMNMLDVQKLLSGGLGGKLKQTANSYAKEEFAMMHRKLYVLILPFLVGVAWADQVTLKNGDRLTGKIEKKDGASLTIKSDIFAPVTIPWEAVTQVTSDEPLTVVLP